MPAEQSVGFAGVEEAQQARELGPYVGFFGGLRFGELVRDGQALLPGFEAHQAHLVFDGLHLPLVAVTGRAAGVEESGHTRKR